ncbi:aldose epimerase [Floridanema evergladense]|uniref:Aldose epimerase n=1 Tax=Floridaenema evergladense BLCC-F167 TaxID=3153639 RepID=A0ABV4WH85_9CYAN
MEFAIDIQQQQYKTYILTDHHAQSRVEVVPERGGIVTRWQLQDQEIFYLDTERFTNPNLSVRGGIPILFPICGNLPDDTYTIHEKEYKLKQHGFARELPWQVIDQQTQESASITLLLESNDQTKQVYPFDFKVTFTYQLKGNTLEIRQSYTNNSSESMPFSTGLHPYFAVTDTEKNQLEFQIPSTQYQEKQNPTIQNFSGSFDFESDEIDVAFRDLTDVSASVTDKSRNLHLHLSYDNSYSRIVFWAVKGKDFYCLEPWSAPRNAMNTGEHLIILEPGASIETVVALTVTFS